MGMNKHLDAGNFCPRTRSRSPYAAEGRVQLHVWSQVLAYVSICFDFGLCFLLHPFTNYFFGYYTLLYLFLHRNISIFSRAALQFRSPMIEHGWRRLARNFRALTRRAAAASKVCFAKHSLKKKSPACCKESSWKTEVEESAIPKSENSAAPWEEWQNSWPIESENSTEDKETEDQSWDDKGLLPGSHRTDHFFGKQVEDAWGISRRFLFLLIVVHCTGMIVAEVIVVACCGLAIFGLSWNDSMRFVQKFMPMIREANIKHKHLWTCLISDGWKKMFYLDITQKPGRMVSAVGRYKLE